MTRTEMIEKIYAEACDAIDGRYSHSKVNELFRMATDWNDANPNEAEIFMCEIDNGFCLEDDYFIFKW